MECLCQLNCVETQGHWHGWTTEKSRKIYKVSKFNLQKEHICLFSPKFYLASKSYLCLFNWPQYFNMASYDCSICGHKCCSRGGLSQHKNSQHPAFPTPTESTRHTRISHQYLNGMINYAWLYNRISDDYLSQHDPVMKMANFSKNPILQPHQLKLLMLIQRTRGHLFQIV